MPHITANDGARIWYEVHGEGEPLVLIGGSSLVRRQWDFMLPILKDRFKVILYDQRGAGLSDRSSSGITVDRWADDLREILDEIQVKRTHLFGTSNGSFIVIRFAAKYPERTASAIHYGMYKLKDQAARMARIGYRIIDEFGTGRMGCYFLVRLYGMPALFEEWEVRRFEENISPEPWKAMHEALKEDLSRDLEGIKAPQLLLTGDSGPLSKDSDYGSGWKDVKALCPRAEVAVINGAEGTYCVVTHPAEVSRTVIEFLDKHKMA